MADAWLSAPTPGPHWLKIDLGQERQLAGVTVSIKDSQGSDDFELHLSNDGFQADDRVVAEGLSLTGEEHTLAWADVPFPAQGARWLKVVFNSQVGEAVRVMEVEAWAAR